MTFREIQRLNSRDSLLLLVRPMFENYSDIISNVIEKAAINAFVLATYIVQFLFFFKIRNFKPLTFFCTALFVSDLVGIPEDWFSRDEVHFETYEDDNIITTLT